MGDFYAYDEPSFSSKVANAGAKYGRQTFRIVDGTTDGWLKFKTWEAKMDESWLNKLPSTKRFMHIMSLHLMHRKQIMEHHLTHKIGE